jgi:hypothetical protein
MDPILADYEINRYVISVQRKDCSAAIFPPQDPYGLAWDRNRVSFIRKYCIFTVGLLGSVVCLNITAQK